MNSMESDKKDQVKKRLQTFLAIWDDHLGPKIIDIYPKFKIGDLEDLSIHIFQFYEFFFKDTETPYIKTDFVIPVFKMDRKAKVFFNSIRNANTRGGFQPYFVVVLVPDYFEDNELKIFDEILLKISQDFLKKQFDSLQDYYQELKNVLSLKLIPREPEIKINENYSYSAAMEDFQAGITLFTQNNLEEAYQILKKVLLKFEKEQHLNLIAEVLYLLANIHVKQKRYEEAKGYYSQLNDLYEKIKDKKYQEISLFMEGFCSYKVLDFLSANLTFKKLYDINPKKVNLTQFYTIFGKSLASTNKLNEAFDMLNHALKSSYDLKLQDKKKKQQAQIFYEMGTLLLRKYEEQIYKEGYIRLREFQNYLIDSLNFFKKSYHIVEEIGDEMTSIHLLLSIANIYGLMDDEENNLEYHLKAINLIETKDIHFNKLTILKKIIQLLDKLSYHERKVRMIERILENLDEYKFIDAFTIASFYENLGTSLISLSQIKKGLANLEEAQELLSSFNQPIHEELIVLNRIIKILTELKEYQDIARFSNRLKVVSENLQKSHIKKPTLLRPMGEIKEIWIFSTISGVKLYSYAPETELDHDLLGGFFSALKGISIEVAQRPLDSITVGDDLYTLYQDERRHFFILGRSDSKIAVETAKKILNVIYLRFWKEFHEQIINFQGNITPFHRFDNVIEALDLTLTMN